MSDFLSIQSSSFFFFAENHWLELGAQYIHGQDNNLYELCAAKDLLWKDKDVEDGGGVFITETGQEVCTRLVNDLIDYLDKMQDSMHEHSGQSVYEYFKEKFNKFITTHKIVGGENLQLLKAAFRWYVIFEVIDNSCQDLHHLSALSYTEWALNSNEDLYVFKRDYFSVVRELIKDLPIERLIQFNTAVNKIEVIESRKSRTKSSVFQVKLSTVRFNGNVEEVNFAKKILSNSLKRSDIKWKKSFTFDHVIVTSSVGFLKENLDMFAFNLPDAKVQVINSLGYGVINKVFLHFAKPFWDAERKGFQVLWLTVQDEFSYETGNKIYGSAFPDWVYCVQGFEMVQPNCLMAWIGSHGAQSLEDLSDEEIGTIFGQVLRKIIPESCRIGRVEDPISVTTSRWYSHPYVRGSYSNRPRAYAQLPLGLEYNIDALAEPIRVCDIECSADQWPLVSFAGEATDRHHYSTVDGAMHSGEREADRILSLYSSHKSV